MGAAGAAGAPMGGLELEEPPPQPETIVETTTDQKIILIRERLAVNFFKTFPWLIFAK
jgi:hypothetical protein